MQTVRTPIVSIILPTFNRQRFLAQAFEAIRAQICTEWELIVVDDGSTDGTREKVADLARTLEQPVRYIHQENRGAYGARNTGVENATGEFVAFYDSDDLWLPHHLIDCLAAFERHSELDWVYGSCRRIDYATGRVLTESSFYVDGKPRPFLKLKARQDGRLHIIEDDRRIECQIVHGLYSGLQNSVIRRAVFAQQRFCERFRVVEDELFLVRALAAGARSAYYMETHFIYRVHDDNSSASSSSRPSDKMLPIFRELVEGFEQLSREVSFNRSQRRALRRRLSREYFWHLGYHGLWLTGRRHDALAAFRRGIALYPWDFSFWKAYLGALVRMYMSPVPSPQP